MIKLFQFSEKRIDYFTCAIETTGSTRGINKLQSLFLSTPYMSKFECENKTKLKTDSIKLSNLIKE